MTDWDGMQAAAAKVNSELGGVDSVFAAAGVIHRGSLLDSDVADIERVMAVNWRGLMYTVKAYLPAVADSEDGRIVTQDHGLAFCWEDGRPIYPDTITEEFNRMVDLLGLPKIRFHDIQHSYATISLRAGVHPKIVRK